MWIALGITGYIVVGLLVGRYRVRVCPFLEWWNEDDDAAGCAFFLWPFVVLFGAVTYIMWGVGIVFEWCCDFVLGGKP